MNELVTVEVRGGVVVAAYCNGGSATVQVIDWDDASDSDNRPGVATLHCLADMPEETRRFARM